MRLTYCFVICLMRLMPIISCASFYQKGTPDIYSWFHFFEVALETKEAISMMDTDMIHVTVKSWHDDGKPFHGEACLELVVHDYNIGKDKSINPGCKEIVNGRTKYDFNLTEPGLFFETSNYVDKTIFFMLSVTEREYQYTNYDSQTVEVYANLYDLDRCKSSDTCTNLRANEEQDVVYQITHVDGSPISDTKSTVELTYTDMFDIDESQCYSHLPPVGNRPLTFTGHMNEMGFVHFKVQLPDLEQYKGCTHFFAKKLKYLNQESIYSKVHLITEQPIFYE